MAESYIAELGYKVDTSPLKRGEVALDNMTKAGNRTETGMAKLHSTVGVLSAGIAALAANTVINDLINYSDSWARVDNQLRLVISSETELIDKREKLIKLSKDTNANLDSTVALYAELYRNTRELGTSEEAVLNVTRTLNNLFVSGGKDAQTQAGAIRQLSQALGAGALRGDEFNSVAEAAPRILDAISLSTGMAKGELRDFAATGGITAEILVDAVNSYAGEAQRLADVTTKTFEQSTENARTNALAYIGASKSIQDATMALGGAIESASENIDAIIGGVKAGATVIIAAAVPSFIKYTASIYANVAAQLVANTQSVRTVSALGTVTVATGSATVATNALNIATKALLSPWALVLTAVGAAAAMFTFTKSESDKLKGSLANQAGEVEKLEKKYREMGKAQLGSASVAARKELIDIEIQRREAMAKFNKDVASPNESIRAGAYAVYQRELKALDGQAKKVTTTLDAMNKAFADNMPDEWIDPSATGQGNEELNKQMLALKQMQKEIGLTADELFLFRQEQRSIANGDAPEVTAAIVKQAQAIIDQRNALKKSKSEFQDLFGTDTVDLKALQDSIDYDAWITGIEESINRAQILETEMGDVWDAMLGGDLDWDIGLKKIEQLQNELDSLQAPKDIGFDIVANGATDSLKAMQSLSAQGSKEYRKLGVAIEAVNTIQAVAAVLNQAAGDPYTAFARMAAMAASVASLGYSVGSVSGGGFDDVAAERQEKQGTTIWGDKSESISNGIDITANAVEKLVGINSNMLKALTSVQDGISKAAALIGRDVTTPTIDQGKLTFNYDDVMGIFEPLGIEKLLLDPLGLFGKTFNKLFGGSSKVVDEGIMIIGGKLGEMIDDITVQSFQQVQYKKWRFGSKKNKTATEDITDTVGSQFQLVLDSIADSVYTGATMLGLAGDEVEKAIQNFDIETIKISLKGLSPEEQQAEIQAVFSSIFDDLAGGVVPFLDQFQKAGEGLGETLVRVATQVNIMDLLVEQLGVTMFDKMANPEMYAAAAENISDLVGGVEEFAEKTSSFVNNFASDDTKLGIYQDSLEKSFSSVGLSLPETAQGMWDLMDSLDGSTAAGQEQIAMLLNMQDQSAAYYDLLDKSSEKIAEAAKRYRDAIGSMYDITEEIATASLDAALRAARAGDMTLAEELDLGSVAPDSSNYSTMLEYELARAETAAKLEELAKITEGTISIDEKQLETLEQIRDGIAKSAVGGNADGMNELKSEMKSLNEIQMRQSRTIVDSNALLQQMVIDGIPVRVET
ncbi:coil containing protein [Vibrio phage 137E35-1]|nr:coil containing protein [Vibrio phage 137E35-1]CAH9015668.1 coil containing protein [Vibrio phage 230E39-1]